MSKFNLKKFLDDVCERHPHISSLYEVIRKHHLEHILGNKGNFTFVLPSARKVEKLKSLPLKEIKELLFKSFIPGKFTEPKDWKSGSALSISLKHDIVPKKNSVLFDKAKLKFSSKVDSIPVWVEVKTGGAFNTKETALKKESTFTSGMFDEIMNAGGFENVVAILYNSLDEKNKEIADCLITGHPLAEYFLLHDSPFINCDVTNLDLGAEVPIKYEELLKKKGQYLVNSGDLDKIALVEDILSKHDLFSENSIDFYSSIQAEGTYDLNDENIKIIHPELAPYMHRISVYICIISEIEKAMNEAESPREQFDKFIEAFMLNATTNVKVSFEEFVSSDDVSSLISTLANFQKRCGCVLFKKFSVEGAGEKKKKKRKTIKLTPATRKALTSSASSNK